MGGKRRKCSAIPKIAKKKKSKKNKNGSQDKLKSFSKFSILDDSTWVKLESTCISQQFFSWLIAPISIETFFSDYFEKKALYIPRNEKSESLDKKKAPVSKKMSKKLKKGTNYWKGIFGKKNVEKLLRNKKIKYGKDIDVTKYQNGQRSTENKKGRANVDEVWKQFNSGCSIRFLCPQRWSKNVWRLVHLMDEFWGCQAGANTYLTPENTQGFAPHYDDVDIFVLQTEGAKRWRLYKGPNPGDTLAEVSSSDFKQDEIGDPYFDRILRAGDLLYAPRGEIHQCVACPGQDSMHITLSICYRNSWGNFLRKMLPIALEIAFKHNLAFRKSLPRDYSEYMGLMHSDSKDSRRIDFKNYLISLMNYIMDNEILPMDDVCDSFVSDFLHSRVPPILSEQQKMLCSSSFSPISLQTRFRLLKRGIARLLSEEKSHENDDSQGETIMLQHCAGNSRLYKGRDIDSYQIPIQLAPAIETILLGYPAYYTGTDLLGLLQEIDEDDENVSFNMETIQTQLLDTLNQMFDMGILMLHPDKKLRS